MTTGELRKMRRIDLLEMLLQLSEENEQLKEQLARTQQELNDKTTAMEQYCSLDEAISKLNHVVEATQAIYEQSCRQNHEKESECNLPETVEQADPDCNEQEDKLQDLSQKKANQKRNKIDYLLRWCYEQVTKGKAQR